MKHAEITGTPPCVISLDFQEPLTKYPIFFHPTGKIRNKQVHTNRYKNLYSHATSTVQVNGYTSDPIPIQCAIRQGCPLSMLLYALSLHPILTPQPESKQTTNRKSRTEQSRGSLCRRHNFVRDLSE